MTTTTQLVGKPIAVDYIVDNFVGKEHRVEVQFCCGTYTDFIRFEFRSEADAAHAFMMWQELIVAAGNYQAE